MQKKLAQQGLRFLEEGQLEKARQILSLLIRSFPDNADAHHMLGLIELEKGNFEAAYILVNTAIDLLPNNSMFYNTLANIELHRKNVDKSEHCFLTAIRLDPEKIDYKYNLANFYLTQNKYEQAVDYFYTILHSNPAHYLAMRGITVCYLFSGETDIALEHAIEWVNEQPNYDEAHYYHGLCLQALHHIPAALAAYDKAIDLSPNNQAVIIAIGACYRDLGNLNIAENYLHEALSLDNNNPLALYHLANIKFEQGDIGSAHDLFSNAISLDPYYAEPLCGLGCIELFKGDETAALEFFEHATQIEPNNFRARLLKASTLLKQQNFVEGWKALNKCYITSKALSKIPLWDGRKLADDQVLLVWSSTKHDNLEQQILFCSMLPDLQQNVRNAVVLIDSRLVNIVQNSFPQFKVFSNLTIDSVVNNYQVFTQQTTFSALGGHYRLSLSDFYKLKAPFYLHAEPSRTQHYINKYRGMFGTKKLIGIACKAESTANVVEHIKTIHLKDYFGILEAPNCQFISLQANINSKDQHPNLYWDPDCDSVKRFELCELAAQISSLDLVITPENYLAHLAGSLGIKVYLLLSKRAEWYWFKAQKESLFYPNTCIFEQNEANDWHKPLKDIENKL